MFPVLTIWNSGRSEINGNNHPDDLNGKPLHVPIDPNVVWPCNH